MDGQVPLLGGIHSSITKGSSCSVVKIVESQEYCLTIKQLMVYLLQTVRSIEHPTPLR